MTHININSSNSKLKKNTTKTKKNSTYCPFKLIKKQKKKIINRNQVILQHYNTYSATFNIYQIHIVLR